MQRGGELCPYCRQPCRAHERMETHLRTCQAVLRPQGGIFRCSICRLQVESGEALRAHLRRCLAVRQVHHETRPLPEVDE
jgi:hypothetical protein